MAGVGAVGVAVTGVGSRPAVGRSVRAGRGGGVGARVRLGTSLGGGEGL